MEAQVSRAQDVTVIKLKGFLDFEVADSFKKNCLQNIVGEKVVFNLRELSFVGSSGITPFIEMLCEFSNVNVVRPKFCGMTSEFKRLFLSTQITETEIFEDEGVAISSFALPPMS